MPSSDAEEHEEAPKSPESRGPEALEALPRLPNGRFQPGVSGNPGGLSKDVKQIRERARAHGEDAIRVLFEIMKNSDDDRARIVAATALLDRGYGKPVQELTGADGDPLFEGVIILPAETPDE